MDEIFFIGDRVQLTGVGWFAGQAGTVNAKAKDSLEDQYRVSLDNGIRVWAYHSEIKHFNEK
jgi:hypothetical protein